MLQCAHAFALRFFGLVALDDDAGEVRGGVDEAKFVGAGGARLAKVEGDRPQHLAGRGERRLRPARAQAVRQCRLSIVCPQLIMLNIGNDHRLAAKGRRAARSRLGADGQSVQPPDEFFRQAESEGEPQALALGVEDSDGAHGAGQASLDGSRQRFQNLLKGRAGGDEFEDGSLILGDVFHLPPLGDVASYPQHLIFQHGDGGRGKPMLVAAHLQIVFVVYGLAYFERAPDDPQERIGLRLRKHLVDGVSDQFGGGAVQQSCVGRRDSDKTPIVICHQNHVACRAGQRTQIDFGGGLGARRVGFWG